MTEFMNRINAHNMAGRSHLPGYCSICGRMHPEKHHVVARSLGGVSGPMIHLCGFGSNLRGANGELFHHGAAEHHMLWFWWSDGRDEDIAPKRARVLKGWIYLLVDTPVDIMTALASDGWKKVF